MHSMLGCVGISRMECCPGGFLIHFSSLFVYIARIDGIEYRENQYPLNTILQIAITFVPLSLISSTVGYCLWHCYALKLISSCRAIPISENVKTSNAYSVLNLRGFF